VETKKRIIVGVNQFQMEEKPVEGLLRVDASVGELQTKKLAKLRAERDNKAVEAKLAALSEAAKDESVNLMPLILDAVKAYATLGEICGVLRKIFGEYKAQVSL